ncbi:MAG: hypothetical protein IPH64_03665 [Comamonadaceae bacterium]|nr:hypothetical protein [Comamonadaceae bacterium]
MPGLKVDVAQPASVSGLARQLAGEAIDIALYVAGVMGAPAPPAAHPAGFDRVMHTNVLGAMRSSRRWRRWWPRSQGQGGRFVFLVQRDGQIGTVAAALLAG